MSLYLDYNATSPLCPKAMDAITAVMGIVGNASSVHNHGRQVRKLLEQARERIATALGVDAIDITFTSGATESNNMVLRGHPSDVLIISPTEHPSVLEAAKNSGKEIIYLPIDSNGLVDIDGFKILAKEYRGKNCLVSVMAVNNESGVIQPIAKIASICRKNGAELHCDAAQAIGKVDMKDICNANYISLSAHKCGGPMGVGALVYSHHLELKPLFYGGGQERRRRSGTENVMGIVGFSYAVEEAEANREANCRKWQEWQKKLETKIKESCPKALIVGEGTTRVSQTCQIVLPTVAGHKQVMFMDMNNISVSSGSACSSGSIQASHVLMAQGIQKYANDALRISWGSENTYDDIDYFITVWIKMVSVLLKR